jgi:hypothetical protein
MHLRVTRMAASCLKAMVLGGQTVRSGPINILRTGSPEQGLKKRSSLLASSFGA